MILKLKASILHLPNNRLSELHILLAGAHVVSDNHRRYLLMAKGGVVCDILLLEDVLGGLQRSNRAHASLKLGV